MQVFKIIPIEVYQKCMKNEEQVTKDDKVDISIIVSMLKPRQKTRAEAILSLLTHNNDFSWNAKGEII